MNLPLERQPSAMLVPKVSKDTQSAFSYHEPAAVQNPRPTDLPAFLTYASKQLQLPFLIDVLIKEEEELTTSPTRLYSLAPGVIVKSSEDAVTKSSSPQAEAPTDKSTLTLVAEVNKSGQVTTLAVPKGQRAPRVLFRTIALSLPYQPHLTKLTIASVDYINGALIYDLANILPHSFITELILDDSPVFEANQYLILESAKNLQHLSLNRCCLGDIGIKKIAATLEPPRSAAYTLKDLSVSSNAITDIGAAALTHMLRTNRKLIRLNLSGNQISDKGGVMLLTILGLFELTEEEKIISRKRHMEYLKESEKLANQIHEKEMANAIALTGIRRAPSNIRARKTIEISTVIDDLHKAKDHLDECKHPFLKPNVTTIDDHLYSLGNMSLCFLNLAFNNLKRYSIVKLKEVLWYQSNALLKNSTLGYGLLHVVIDGNDPFVSRKDLDVISDLIDKAMERRGSFTTKKRSRPVDAFQSRTSLKLKSKTRS